MVVHCYSINTGVECKARSLCPTMSSNFHRGLSSQGIKMVESVNSRAAFLYFLSFLLHHGKLSHKPMINKLFILLTLHLFLGSQSW